eukprot:4002730-Alexandrium_andersonii.AAC.1
MRQNQRRPTGASGPGASSQGPAAPHRGRPAERPAASEAAVRPERPVPGGRHAGAPGAPSARWGRRCSRPPGQPQPQSGAAGGCRSTPAHS